MAQRSKGITNEPHHPDQPFSFSSKDFFSFTLQAGLLTYGVGKSRLPVGFNSGLMRLSHFTVAGPCRICTGFPFNLAISLRTKRQGPIGIVFNSIFQAIRLSVDYMGKPPALQPVCKNITP